MNKLQNQALSKAAKRLLPFLFCLYLLAYLDRINVGFAQLQMDDALGFSDTVYGFGASIFFIGFTLFEIPSNLILQRVGAKWWIARIMLTWGLISSGMAWIETPTHFYIMRFALGAAEAGFFPGIILYLSHWFPDDRRARVISTFMTATALAGVIGAPLSGLILDFHGLWGLEGWQWLFLIEGMPSVIASLLVFWVLPNTPYEAGWLTPQEKDAITTLLAEEKKVLTEHLSLSKLVTLPKIWRLGLFYFSVILVFNSLSLWLSQIIKSSYRLDNTSTALLTALPFLTAVLSMMINGIHSDRTGERRWHILIPAVLGASGLVMAAAMERHPEFQLAGLCLATAGVWATLGPFWTLPTSMLRGNAAAAGFALINSIGAIGGFIGPNLMALCKTYSGDFSTSLLALAGIIFLGCLQFARSERIPR